MAKTYVTSELRDYAPLIREMRGIKNVGENIIKHTISDMRTKAPTKMGIAVRAVYNVSPGAVSLGKKSKKGKRIGGLRLKGSNLESIQFKFFGRRLIPTKEIFSLEAKQPSKKGLPFQMTATVEKGRTEKLPKDAFVTTNRWNRTLPYQRLSSDRLSLKPIKTISLPEMIDDTRVRQPAQAAIDAEIEARIKHHIKQANQGSKYLLKEPRKQN